jgi:hypothetical protein
MRKLLHIAAIQGFLTVCLLPITYGIFFFILVMAADGGESGANQFLLYLGLFSLIQTLIVYFIQSIFKNRNWRWVFTAFLFVALILFLSGFGFYSLFSLGTIVIYGLQKTKFLLHQLKTSILFACMPYLILALFLLSS